MSNKNININFGCFGSVITLISIIIFCAIFSLFLGSGEFYNDCIKKAKVIVQGDTISVVK